MDKKLPVRKPLRLTDYDYSSPGGYFITFCTHNRKQTLSRIVGAIHESPVTQLTPCGSIVENVMNSIPEHLGVTVDRYVIMPNHVHLIALIKEENTIREIHESPLRGRSSISNLIGYIKMNASKSIRKRYGDVDVWQRGYYDHVIRNQEDYNMLAEYIEENPLRWKLDKLYSEE